METLSFNKVPKSANQIARSQEKDLPIIHSFHVLSLDQSEWLPRLLYNDNPCSLELGIMTKMSDLSEKLVGEIQSRVPMTSLRSVRSTCKNWNALSKKRIFGKSAAKRKQFLGFMMMDSRVCSMKFDLRNDEEEVDFCIKQVSILNQVEISKLFHCDGLLLCVIKDNSKLLVWNPYLGQTRWIQPRNIFHRFDRYALGYDDKDNRNHKILRFLDDYLHIEKKYFLEYEIYDFSSNSWRVLDVTPDWEILFYQRGVSLKGNTYFFAQEKITGEGVGDEVIDTTETEDFLICFDFTAERFGQRLPLPIHSYYEDTVTLSCVREEQLSVLYQATTVLAAMEIWITTKIEPNAVSWSKFLKVDLKPLIGFQFDNDAASFFIDEEKKVAVVFDLDGYKRTETCRYQTAYIIGQDGCVKSVNIGEAPNLAKPGQYWTPRPVYCVPLVCSSYVPSLVQITI